MSLLSAKFQAWPPAFLRFGLSLVLLLCAWPVPAGAEPGQGSVKNRKPNILILYADDLGYGDLASYNPASKIPTPHLDRLASQGMRFTDAHSSSGVCSPSRHALLTGRYHWRDFHEVVKSFGPSVFRPGIPTLPAMLRAEGYATAAIGKWHLGWDWNAIKKESARPGGRAGKNQVLGPEAFDWSRPIPGGPLSVGFDHYFGDDVINFPPYCWIEDDKVVRAPDTMMDPRQWKPLKEGAWECRPGPMATGWDPYQNIPVTTARAVDFILSRKDAEKPFFLYFAYPSPHAPIIPNEEFRGKSGAGPYGDFLVETDHSIGRILGALEEAGLADDTLVVFSADNGPEHYAYLRDKKFAHWSSHPLRGVKRDLYEGGHRIPFLARWPGVVPPGRVCDALVSQIDLMATFAAVVGHTLPPNAAVDSHDLLPVLRGGSGPVRENLIHNTTPEGYAIRQGDWVLVESRDGYVSRRDPDWESRHSYPADDDHPVELYHLKADLAQKQNLAAAHPEKVQELGQALRRIRQQARSAPRLQGAID
jgi:arylsulfatase A